MERTTASGHTIKRTSVDLDVDELRAAKRTLGTVTTRDTINTALREVNRRAALRRAARLIRGGGLNIVQPDDLTRLRRPRG
jgi:Arc/MetJ family transcription regulator